MRFELLRWQQNLVTRLERGLGRELISADFQCIAWNDAAETLTVASPLLRELRHCGLISNTFRSQHHSLTSE